MKVLFLPFVLFLSGCGSYTSDKLTALDWLVGEWERKGVVDGSRSTESWSRQNAMTYVGFGMTIREGDTLFYENLRIVEEEGIVYYIADVGEGEVKFKLTSSSNTRWVFSNPTHDFPKKIIYAKKEDGNLLVTISGADRKVDFDFIRISQ